MATEAAGPVIDPQEEETIAATAALLAGLLGATAAAAAATEKKSAPAFLERLFGATETGPTTTPATGPSLGSRFMSAVSGAGSRMVAGMASIPTGAIVGGSGPGLSMSALDVYTGSAPTLSEYVEAAAKAATLGPFTGSATDRKEGDVEWANAIINSMGSRSAARTLQDHVNLFDKVPFVEPNEDLAKKDDLTMKIDTPGGEKSITVRNPYKAEVSESRIAAKGEGGSLPAGANRDAIATLGVGHLGETFADSRRQVRLLEALWLCGNNRGIGCFPEQVMLELVEAKKVGSEAAAHVAARRILQGSSLGMMKAAVEKYVASVPKPVAAAPVIATPTAAVPEASVVTKPVAAPDVAKPTGGARRTLRVKPTVSRDIGAIHAEGFLPRSAIGVTR